MSKLKEMYKQIDELHSDINRLRSDIEELKRDPGYDVISYRAAKPGTYF